MVISTGMSYLDEVALTVRTAEEAGCRQLALMHCTSLYPSPAATLNLASMQTLAQAFPYPVGYSDHYDGTTASVAATALGARLLEKHFTLDRSGPGPDDHFAVDPAQLARLVREVREIEQMLGSGIKAPDAQEERGRAVYRRCLMARRAIAAGEVLSEDAVGFKRPKGDVQGLPPSLLPHVIGLRAKRPIQRNEHIRFEQLESVGTET
jgi:N-acetylneuraminate synthase/N,N'-diacetyllegionaminate synthase